MSFQRTCTTRTFARNFCPEVGQFFEFHCPLINKDSCSLAETLETAELFIEFWHQVPAGKDTYVEFKKGLSLYLLCRIYYNVILILVEEFFCIYVIYVNTHTHTYIYIYIYIYIYKLGD